jgi:hypothetical protein
MTEHKPFDPIYPENYPVVESKSPQAVMHEILLEEERAKAEAVERREREYAEGLSRLDEFEKIVVTVLVDAFSAIRVLVADPMAATRGYRGDKETRKWDLAAQALKDVDARLHGFLKKPK